MKPLLICETGLHGNGEAEYYLSILDRIRRIWTGWPPIALKMQHWCETDSAWARLVLARHGRMPLKSVNDPKWMEEIAEVCHTVGVELISTPHDETALKFITPYVDRIKLGAFDATQEPLVDAAVLTGKDLILSTTEPKPFKLKVGATTEVRVLITVPAYPANEPHRYQPFGYSCHAVPILAKKFIVSAAERGCKTIEVHVTDRSKELRPLPGDMCVSLSVFEFLELAERLGSVWSA